MKSRGGITCECCKIRIPTGHQIVRYAGRYWMIEHYREYKDDRLKVNAGRVSQRMAPL